MAAPFNMHSTNWVWVNKALFDKVGGPEPTTWENFVALAGKFKEAGVIPVAHGGQAWQDATIFDGAVISAGGPDFYKKAFIELDEESLASPTMAKAFDQLRAIRGMVDPNFSGRDWNLATAMVINGQAGMQIMGDWAKGEFVNAGKTPGTDFLCFRYPGTQGTVTFNSDAFGMMKVGEEEQAAQFKLAAPSWTRRSRRCSTSRRARSRPAATSRTPTSTPAARRASRTPRRPPARARSWAAWPTVTPPASRSRVPSTTW